MKKRKIIIFTIAFFIIIVLIIGILKNNKVLNNKRKEKKRYIEIKESVKKAVEWNIKVMYPKCPIKDTSKGEKKKKQNSI